MNDIIIDFSHEHDEALPAVTDAVVKGCTGNTDTKIIALLAVVVTNLGPYKTSLADTFHGDNAATVLKNKNKLLLVDSLRDLGIEVNIQNKGDREKALKCGFPLVKTPSHQMMGDVENFKVETTSVAGVMALKVHKPSTYVTHGTVFAFWDVALGPTPTDRNKWFHRQSNGHHINIGGLTPGTSYPFAAAYKGLDNEPLIWSNTITKMVGD